MLTDWCFNDGFNDMFQWLTDVDDWCHNVIVAVIADASVAVAQGSNWGKRCRYGNNNYFSLSQEITIPVPASGNPGMAYRFIPSHFEPCYRHHARRRSRRFRLRYPLGSGPPHRGPGVNVHLPPVSLWSLPYPPLMPSPPCTAKSSLLGWSSIRVYSIVSIGDGFG